MKKVKKMFEKHDLFKLALLAVFVTIVLTWIIPSGVISGGELIESEAKRQGLVDIMNSGAYSVSFFTQQILLILFVGIFYGIVSKVSGYQSLTSKIANKFKKKEKSFVLIASLFITLLTTFLTQAYLVIIFIPFIISIAKKLSLDKITTFLCTFGSLLIGVLGATYGTESFVYFIQYLNYYTQVDLDVMLAVRFGILVLAFIVFNFFTIRHLNSSKANKNEEIVLDVFETDEKSNKKAKTWPIALFGLVILAFVILGYVNWEANFNITCFKEFHTWLTGLKIGEYPVISYIIGSNAASFGTWDIYMITLILVVVLVLISVIYRVKLDDMIDRAVDGIKSVIKPLMIVVLVYTIFIFSYWSTFVVTLSSWILSITESFNPFIASLAAALNSFFHLDFGFAGYSIGGLLTTYSGSSLDIMVVIFTTINGLLQIIAPTSAFLVLGLSYMDIPYKKWFKHIWKFFLIMLALLLVIFALLTYL